MTALLIHHMRRSTRHALLCAVALVSLAAPAYATASTAIDVRGTWDCTSTAGGTCQYTISSEDFGTGAFSGTGAGNGYTWTVNGTVSGNQLAMDMPYEGTAYHPYFDGTVSNDGATMSGHSGTAGPCSSNPCPTPYTYTRLSGGGGGGGAAEAVQLRVSCAFRVDLSSHQCTSIVDGTTTPPSGIVTFGATGGAGSFLGSPSCSLTIKTPTPLSSSCTVYFHQGTTTTTIMASYAGDAHHNPSSGSYALAGSIAPFKTVCVSLWVGDCDGFLPAPNPVQVCVAAWQNCNGFGNTKPAKPGTIDLSGFPAELVTPVGCDPADQGARLASASDPGSSKGLTCAIESYISDQSGERTARDDHAQYVQNQILFASEVDDSAARIRSGVTTACIDIQSEVNQTGEAPCRVIVAYNIVLDTAIRLLFSKAKEQGVPVSDIEEPANVDACQTIAADQARQFCLSLVTDTNQLVLKTLEQLKNRKHALGVDVPFTSTRKNLLLRTAEAAVTSRRAARRFHGLAVIGFGYTTVTPGKVGRLRIKLPAWVRAELRRAQRAGRSSVKIRVVTHVSPRAGLLYTQRRTLRLLLRH